MPEKSDVLIVGGGHNGLVCAAYLAATGLKVTVLERRHVVGGAAVTEEFHPGFRNSVAAYTVSLLNPKVIRDLDLHAHGLRVVEREVSNFLPTEDGRYLATGGDRTKREVAKFSQKDAERLDAYGERLDIIADLLRDLVLQTPPNVGRRRLARGATGAGARRRPRQTFQQARHGDATGTAQPVRHLGRRLSRRLVRKRADQSGLRFRWRRGQLRAAPTRPARPTCCFITSLARSTARRAPGVMRSAAWARSRRRWQSQRQLAAWIFALNAGVREIIVENGKAVGAVTESGETFRAAAVVSNLNPKLLYTRLIDPAALPTPSSKSASANGAAARARSA